MVDVEGNIRLLRDASAPMEARCAAATELAGASEDAAYEALVEEVSRDDVPADLAVAVGRAIARVAVRTGVLDEVPWGNFASDAAEAFDAEVGRLQRG